MNAAAALARRQAGDAVNTGSLDHRVVGFPQVDAEQGVPDTDVANRHARRGHVDARGVAAQVAAAPAIDVEAIDRDIGGADADYAAGTRTRQPRTSDAHQHQGPIDQEVALVGAREHLDAVARLRGVDARLQRRGL